MTPRNRTPVDDMTYVVERVGGRDYAVWSNGRRLPIVRGADGETAEEKATREASEAEAARVAAEAAGGGGAGDEGDDGDDAADKERINKIVQKRLREDRTRRDNELKEKLGGKTVEELAEIAAAHQAAEDGKKDEATKAQEKAARETAEAAADKETARLATLRADATTALNLGGIDPKRMKRAAGILLDDLVTLDDLDDDSIKDAIDDLKGEFPEWFDGSNEGEGDGSSRPPAGNPNGRVGHGRRADEGKSGLDAGRERAKREREAAEKSAPKPLDGLRPLGQLG